MIVAKKRQSTVIMLDITRYAVRDTFGSLPSDRQLWESIQDKDLPRTFRAFLWKAMHSVHKLGSFWENILGLKHRASCRDCGEEDGLEHIMLQCPKSGHGTIWPLAKVIWNKKRNRSPVWPEMRNVGAILGVGTANFKKGNKPLTRDNCLFKFLIAESVMLIWTIRLDKYKDKPMPTREEIRVKWVTRMNERLKTDRVSTHRKFSKLVTNRELVLKTWSGTLQDKSNLPDDWIDVSRVLVGVDVREQRAQT